MPADVRIVKTKRIVYCGDYELCGMQYVGQTVCASHRSQIKKRKKKEDNEDKPERFRRKDEGVLAEHLKVVHSLTIVEDFDRSYKFTILKFDVSNLDLAEQKWIDII